MRINGILSIMILTTVNISWANDLDSKQRILFQDIQSSIRAGVALPNMDGYTECFNKKIACMTQREIMVQAVDEMLFDHQVSKAEAIQILKRQLSFDLGLFDFIHILTTFKESLPKLWNEYESEFTDRINAKRWSRSIDKRSEHYLESHSQKFEARWADRYDVAKALLVTEPPIQEYWDGRYYLKPRVYMFCRQNRQQTCLMLMKDATGRLKRHRDGTPWTQVALGYSRHKKDYYQTNGNTPSGVFRIDGVMPTADQKFTFGEYRRLILNFVGSSPNEENYKKLLPIMTHEHLWWMEAVTARNNGRGLFRIHGTGLRSNPRKPYFPMVPTSGCVAKAENRYQNITYKGQRNLLDRLMVSSGFKPEYKNETRLQGLLYVINIDKKDEPVTLESLKEVGIIEDTLF